jgi:ribonuclease HII
MPPKPRRTGQKLLRFDRGLGARFVAGADEAGRGPLAGPLVVAGVLLDYECLREHRVRPLALLNDSKQVDAATRDELYRAVLACAERVVVRVFPSAVIDRDGLHRCNLRGLREALWACQPADASLVDGFKLGPTAPPHRAIVDGDTKSAAIAAASIVAKVTRDRYMHAADALYPAYGFGSHVGYITPSHTRIVRERGPCEIHRRSWRARAYLTDEELRALDAEVALADEGHANAAEPAAA